MKKRYFERGGRGVYECGCCGRATRNTGHGGECCTECDEIAMLDNMVNDNGYKPGDEEYANALADCERYLADAIKKGGDGEAIKANNGYIWREETK